MYIYNKDQLDMNYGINGLAPQPKESKSSHNEIKRRDIVRESTEIATIFFY